MKIHDFATEAARNMLQFAQRPDTGKNVAALVGAYDKKGRAVAVLWTEGCSIPIDEAHGVWGADEEYGEIHYRKADEDDFRYGAFVDSSDRMYFYVQLPDRQRETRVIVASDLLLTAVAGEYIFVFHAARGKFARFAYTNKPLLKAELDALTFEGQRELLEQLQLKFEDRQEER